jgi:hypothetical protein
MMKSISILTKYADKVSDLDWIDPAGDPGALLPKEWGLYLFKNKLTGCIDYIGSATGSKGLYQRLRNQHLQPKYKKSVFRLKLEKELVDDVPDCSATYIRQRYLIAVLLVPEHISIIKALEQILIYEHLPKFNSETTKHNQQKQPDA